MDDDGEIERVKGLMQDLRITGEILRHAGSGASTEEAEKELGIESRFILKTLLLKGKGNSFVGAILTGNRRLRIKTVEQLSGIRPLRFASGEDVLAFTGFRIGGVPPFCLSGKCAVYVDPEVFARDWVVGAAGTDHAGVRFDPHQMRSIGYMEAEISE